MPLLFRVITAVRKHNDQKQFGVQRVYLAYISQVIVH